MLPNHTSSTYEPLLAYPEHDDEKNEQPTLPPRQRRITWPIMLFVLSLALNAALLWGLLSLRSQRASTIPWRGDKPVYTPAENVIRHANQAFSPVTYTSKYHGPPTDAVDDAWTDLYKDALSAIPGSEMMQMVNASDKIAGLDDRYLIQLDIFHQLHCLNTLRKIAWPERYPYVTEQRASAAHAMKVDHIDHCINSIRESLMCNADLSPDVWQVDPRDKVSKIQFNSVHTCRDWSSIQEWAHGARSPIFEFSDKTKIGGDIIATTSHSVSHEGHSHLSD